MKKKWNIIALVLLLVFVFTGCASQAQDTSKYDQATMESYADFLIQNFSVMTADNFAEFEAMSEFELNLLLLQYGLPIEANDFISMMEAWQSAVDECGEFWSLGTYTLTEKTSGATLDVEGEFQIRNATISFAFDENMNIESMDIGGHYELSEILQKAALNTVLGMGTVFVVLIFISFIISLFRFIPMLEAALSKKKTPVQIEAKQVPSTEVMVENEVDDGELVAVIAAAIAMSEGTSTDDFVVRSIKRRRSNNWN